jgi:dTDP-4-amino-4,6-dideoxygalactose transaminase
MPLETTDARINQLLKQHLLKEFEDVLTLPTIGATDHYEFTVAKKLAAFAGTRHAVLVDSGTTALKLGLCLLDIQPGDEVIVPAVTFPSTVLPVLELGATPVFVDVDDTFVLDAGLLEAAITPRTKAVIPVHLFGHVCDMGRILDTCRKHGVRVLEDACQSHGSTWQGRMTGGLGDAGAFSFTLHKTIAGFTGGALTFSDSSWEKRIEDMIYVSDDHPSVVRFGRAGAKLSLLQVADISVKLKLFSLIKKSKDMLKAHYAEQLAGLPGVRAVPDREGTESVRQHVVAEFGRRDDLLAFLRGRDIAPDPAYPPLHRMRLFERYCAGREFPVAERYGRSVVHLPSSPFLGKGDLDRTTAAIREFYGLAQQGEGVVERDAAMRQG